MPVTRLTLKTLKSSSGGAENSRNLANCPTKALATPAPGNDGMEVSDLSDLSDEEQSSSELGSDWENEKHHSKRAKLNSKNTRSNTSVTPATERGRGKKSLSMLLSVPLDILYEILSRLSPKDLLSIYKTNKLFHETLSCSQAASIWKRARVNEDVPEPTPDVSEARWATLLFGGTKCESCRAPNIQAVDFGLRRRVCTLCKKKQLLVAMTRFEKEFPQFDRELLDLLTYSNTGGWSHGHSSNSKFYWKPDIITIGNKWNTLKSDVHKRKRGAEQKLEEFESYRIQLVRKAVRNVGMYSEWYFALLSERTQARADAGQSRKEEIFRRLQELGYNKSDLYKIKHLPEVDQRRELTENIWKRIRPKLETELHKIQREHITCTRRALLTPLLVQYTQGLKPNAWVGHPSIDHLLKMQELECLLQAGDDHEAVKTKFRSKIIPQLPALAERWRNERRGQLIQVLTKQSAEPTLPLPTTGAVPNILDLATSIFYCTACSGRRSGTWGIRLSDRVQFYGWDDARFHLEHSFEFSEEACVMTRKLAELAGLDPLTTTSKDMDEKGMWYCCVTCMPKLEHRSAVYAWKEAIAHTMGETHLGRPLYGSPSSADLQPTWRLLTTEERGCIKAKDSELDIRSRCWSCNHCSANHGVYETWNVVRAHLNVTHSISNSKPGQDLILCPSESSRAPRFIYKALDAQQAQDKAGRLLQNPYRCKECKTHKEVNRPFNLSGVRSHLKDRHKITGPEQGVHFTLA